MNISSMLATQLDSIDEVLSLRKIVLCALRTCQEIYLVGGWLRDCLLVNNRDKKNILDLDITVDQSACVIGRHIADVCGGSYVLLDKENDICRIVFSDVSPHFLRVQLDISRFKGKTIEEDLLKRDITINSMAISLKEWVYQQGDLPLLDPAGGLHDGKTQCIRMVYEKTFLEDPLRILRIFSFAAVFHFKIEECSLSCAKRDKALLGTIAGERIAGELIRLFQEPHASIQLSMLDRAGILDIIFPEIISMRGVIQGPYHHLDVWTHSLLTYQELENLFLEIRAWGHPLYAYVPEMLTNICGDTRYEVLVKIAALFHDIAKPLVRREDAEGKVYFWQHEIKGMECIEAVGMRLKLARAHIDSLMHMVGAHLQPAFLLDSPDAKEQAWIRFFRKFGNDAVGAMLLSIADRRATQGVLSCKKRTHLEYETLITQRILQFFTLKEQTAKNPKLLNGHDVMELLHIPASHKVGEILEAIEEQQLLGNIKTREEAITFLMGFFNIA